MHFDRFADRTVMNPENISNERPAHLTYTAQPILNALTAARARRVLDLGCGNGAFTIEMARRGFEVVGTDFSLARLAAAADATSDIDFRERDLATPLDQDLTDTFDAVVASEVIKHLFLPRQLFDRAAEALNPGGILVVTTPYHGYWKNLALALTNSFDDHFEATHDYCHIKFFSPATLGQLAIECAFEPIAIKRSADVYLL